MIYYSKSTKGFYHTEVQGNNRPSDCVEVTQQDYDALMKANSEGWAIIPGEDGRPTLAETQFIPMTYDMLRRMEYPDIGDQLDSLFHAGVFPPEMAAKLQAVKDKYPKV